MAGKIIFSSVALACGLLFFFIGVYAKRIKKPMWFWSGTEVDGTKITDIKRYNRANGTMWQIYSVLFFISGIIEFWNGIIALIILVFSSTVGTFGLVYAYNRIYKKYSLKIKEQIVIGKIVNVTVDRPLGTYHPEHKNIYYSVNYGYIPDVTDGDGEGQDAYILGVNTPVLEFCGKVIAIIHRLNDIESKLVVCPENMTFTKEEIYEHVKFQEQFFKTEIEM